MAETTSTATDGLFVVVRTTLPNFPPNAEQAEKHTERLLLRPLREDDLGPVRQLRLQPEVMAWTQAGRIDGDLSETKAKLAKSLPPNDTQSFNYAICWKETGELIGIGGCQSPSGMFGWPEFGYMIRREFWGRGLTTEFSREFLKAYAELPRSLVELPVRRESVAPQSAMDVGAGPQAAVEVLAAIIEGSNTRSHGVARKCGLEQFLDFTDDDTRDPSKTVHLTGYRFLLPQRE